MAMVGTISESRSGPSGHGETDTIAAVATGLGKSAVAMVRVSGSGTANVVRRLAGVLPAPRRAVLRKFRDPGDTGRILDVGIVLWFPGPESYTGEDMAEFHLHGGRGVTTAFLSVLCDGLGARPAEPGEFTWRAFRNGRLDLTEVEAIADLIDSETEQQRRQAIGQLGGALRDKLGEWRSILLTSAAEIEAGIDFSDQDDVTDRAREASLLRLESLGLAIDRALGSQSIGRRIRDGFTVVLAGPPNAGKSTLLNVLAGRDMALVSDIAGTTRDAIEAPVDIAGFPVVLVDTAGLGEGRDLLEKAGIRRSRERLEAADLILWISPCGEKIIGAPEGGNVRIVRSKADLEAERHVDGLRISAKTGQGIDELRNVIVEAIKGAVESGEALITRERHARELEIVKRHVARAVALGRNGADEIIAEELRSALNGLGRIVGTVRVEEILGEIFRSFCIGK